MGRHLVSGKALYIHVVQNYGWYRIFTKFFEHNNEPVLNLFIPNNSFARSDFQFLGEDSRCCLRLFREISRGEGYPSVLSGHVFCFGFYFLKN